MDHFCPWVGGVLSETNYKFFIQFTGWTAVFCIFLMIMLAVLLAEMKSDVSVIFLFDSRAGCEAWTCAEEKAALGQTAPLFK